MLLYGLGFDRRQNIKRHAGRQAMEFSQLRIGQAIFRLRGRVVPGLTVREFGLRVDLFNSINVQQAMRGYAPRRSSSMKFRNPYRRVHSFNVHAPMVTQAELSF